MKNDFFHAIQEFRTTEPAKKLMLSALKEIIPTKGNRFAFIISLLLGIFVSLSVGFANETVELLSQICDKLISAELAIFGCIFTVYSILLAFLSDGYMKRLARIDVPGKTSMLKQSIIYYESVLFLYFISTGISGAIYLITCCVDPYARLTSNLLFDNLLASIFLLVYFTFSFRVFYEVKSVIYNTIVLFRASIAYKFIDFSIESDEKDEDKHNLEDNTPDGESD